MAKRAEDIMVDKDDQLEKIEGFCLPDELIRAVWDLKGEGTGFLAITDKRVIFYDKAYFKSRKAVVSIPYRQIASVASEDTGGLLIRKGFFVSDTLTIAPMGSEPKSFEFRGGEKAHKAHSLIMEYLLK